MPEVLFSIRWPDGQVSQCYSPSRVVREHFRPGMVLTIEELVKESEDALNRASERVRAKYGFACTSAASQLEEILSRARAFGSDELITVIELR